MWYKHSLFWRFEGITLWVLFPADRRRTVLRAYAPLNLFRKDQVHLSFLICG